MRKNLIAIGFYFFQFASCSTPVLVSTVHEPGVELKSTATTANDLTADQKNSNAAESIISSHNKENKQNLTGKFNEKVTEDDIKNLSPLTSLELQKYAYELGMDPQKELTTEQKVRLDQRKKLRRLERTLDSQNERLQYSKVLPWLNSDKEKLEFLSVPTIEGRQAWINKNKIWSRQKNLKDYSDVMDSQDIAVGMPTDFVKKSWGEPDQIEVSGNSIYKNERWKYLKQVSTPQGYRQEKRYVYFEGGRVVGWETE